MHDERIERVRKGIPSSLEGIYERALKGKGKANAIRAKCLDCCGWERKEAVLCQSIECPLFQFNPYREEGQ